MHSPHYSRQVVKCPDGGTIALDWYEHSDEMQGEEYCAQTPVVLVLHPLTGVGRLAVLAVCCRMQTLSCLEAVCPCTGLSRAYKAA